MVDVDHFKKFNDRHGHAAGDQALRMVGAELEKVGGGGRAYRYGGEEFAILFPGLTVTEAREPLEEVRAAIADRRFALRSPDRPRKKPDPPRKPTRPGDTPGWRSVTSVFLGGWGIAQRCPRALDPEILL